jgi:small subunit ribosomal protein S1
MTSPADPSPSEPVSDSSAESPRSSGAAGESPPPPAAEHSPEQAEQQRAARIRIGTQRYGTKAPKAVAHPVLAAPSPSLLAQAATLAAARPGETAAGEAPAAEEPRPASAPAHTSKPERPRRAARTPEPPRPLNEAPPSKYPPPNIRAQLSPDLEMEYLEALGGQSIDEMIAGQGAAVAVELEPDSRHQAKVVAIHRDDVFVEIGARQGVVPLRSFASPPEIGAVVDVMVTRFDPAEGMYELALPGAAVEVGDWSEVAEGMLVEARITGHNKGGLECEVNHLRGFIPASQVSMYRVEDLAQFEGQSLRCIITEANPEKRNLVLSHRAVLERERAEAKEKLLQSLEPGQIREGLVRSLQDFGAFVDLGGIDGLIHISQLSWDRVKHPSEVLEVGQKVRVKIQKIDPHTGKISLAYRDLSESPWASAARDFPVKSRVRGRVTRLMDFGAFVRLGPGVEGLVHISELSHKRVFRVSDVLAEGQEVEVLVLSVDPEAQRISLSLKALEARPAAEKEKAEEETAEAETPPPPLKKRQTPLRGGIGGPPTGERFGLKW